MNEMVRIKWLLLVAFVSAFDSMGCGSSASGSSARSTLGISLGSSAIALAQGGTATTAVSLTRTSYARAVTITLAGLDGSGITADPLVIDSSSNTGTLRLRASATAAPGTITGTVQGNGGDGTASVAVTVSARAPGSSLAIAVTPGMVTIPRAGQTTIQVDLTRNNYSRPVTLDVDGLSAAGIESTGALLDAEGTTALITLSASPTTPLGTTAATVRANGGDADAPITATVVASGPFSVNFDHPVVTLRPAETVFALVTVARVGGFAGAIDVTVSGLPAGVVVDPLTIAGTDNFGFLRLRSDGSGSAVSAAPITLTGTSGASSASTTFALTLRGIGVAVLSPTQFIGQGQTAGVTVGVATLTSVPGPRTITVDGVPQGVRAAALQIPESETFGSLLLTAAGNAPTGTATLSVTATSGSFVATTSFALTVEENLVRISSLDPASATMPAGTSRRVVVEVIRTGSFRTLALPVSASGLPTGITADPIFLPTDASSAVVILHAAADAPLGGPATVNVNAGTFGTDPCSFDCTVLASAQLPLTVVEPFGFAAAAPSVSLQQGASSSLTVTLTRNAGFGGSVVLHASGLPDGVTASDVTFDPGVTRAEMVLAATAAASAGDSVLTVTATGAGFSVSHAVPLQIFVPTVDSPSVASFVPRANSVFVGERTQLTAVFSGDAASIDGIGPVQSGQAVDTPVLSRSTAFTLSVRRGTQQVEARVAVDAVYRNRFRQLAPATARGDHLAATLPDGSALLIGGHTSDIVPSGETVQRFDPATETTLAAPDLPFVVDAPETSSVQLLDGRILLIGGGINSSTIGGLGHDEDRLTLSLGPADQRFVRVGNTQQHRRSFTLATALLDGGALLTGGSRGFSLFDSTERFDPTTGHWSNAASMSTTRVGHTATRLPDGRVLVVGGLTCCKVTADTVSAFGLDTAEIYDPDTDQFTLTGSLAAARGFHTATLLSDGRVLIAGGQFGTDTNPSPTSAEIYDPATGEFTPAGSLQVARGFHTAVQLTDGRVLVVGGTAAALPFVGIQSTEIYDPATNSWSLGPLLQPAWIESTVTLLGNGKVLVFAGEDPNEFAVSTVMLFE